MCGLKVGCCRLGVEDEVRGACCSGIWASAQTLSDVTFIGSDSRIMHMVSEL